MKKFTVVTHYWKDDKEMCEDYYDIEIVDENGIVVATFGDYYHDHGNYKVGGWLEGVRFVTGEDLEITYKDVADRK